jgi:hypothetical protein
LSSGLPRGETAPNSTVTHVCQLGAACLCKGKLTLNWGLRLAIGDAKDNPTFQFRECSTSPLQSPSSTMGRTLLFMPRPSLDNDTLGWVGLGWVNRRALQSTRFISYVIRLDIVSKGEASL